MWSTRALIAVLMITAAGNARADSPLKVGADADWPPGSYLDKEGKPQGFDVDITRAVMRAIGANAQFELRPWGESYARFEKGELDLLIGVAPSPTREARFYFSRSYRTHHKVIFARKNSGHEGRALQELLKLSIVVERQSAAVEFATKLGAKKLIKVESEREALRAVASGRGELAFTSRLHGLLQARQEDLDVVPVGPSWSHNGLHIVAAKDRGALIERINEGLAIIRASGEYERIYEQWYGDRAMQRRGGSLAPAIVVGVVVGVLTAVLLLLIARPWRRRGPPLRVLGSYRLLERLGQGGMGEVWRAEHIKLKSPAAIKLIRMDGQQDPSKHARAQRRFEREATATASLSSPNTIKLFDFGTAEDGSFYYAMELLEGLDLQLMVARFGPMSHERVVYLLKQICDSLDEAHAAGLLHRDIKPANIFISKLGTTHDVVKVLDFGLVRANLQSQEPQLTRDDVGGTAAFAAPELIGGTHPVDERSDLYSLGCVAYWMLSGEILFDTDTPTSTAIAHLSSPPVPLRKRAPTKVDPELEALVMRCLQKSPEDRPESAKAVAAALERMNFAQPWTPKRAADWWRNYFSDHLQTHTGAD